MNHHQPALFTYITPHAPTLLEDEAYNRPSSLIEALREEGRQLQERNIDGVIALTTHWQPEGAFLIDPSPRHRTVDDYYGFSVRVDYDCPGWPEMAENLRNASQQTGLPTAFASHGADHAITIPLHFLLPKKNLPVLPVAVPQVSVEEVRRFGEIITQTVLASGKRVLLLASGSLSHNLGRFVSGTDTQNDEFHFFDRLVMDKLAQGKGGEVESIEPDLRALAMPEGNFRDLHILLGALGEKAKGRTLAYQLLPGVGLALIRFADYPEKPLIQSES